MAVETTLRRAAGQPHVDPRVRKNLALVVGLQGRWPEADGIVGRQAGLRLDRRDDPARVVVIAVERGVARDGDDLGFIQAISRIKRGRRGGGDALAGHSALHKHRRSARPK